MIKEDLNQLAISTIKNLEDNGYFENLQIIDQEIRDNKDPLDIAFYLSKEDKVSYIYGELKIAYGKLKSALEKYIVYRKFQLVVEYEKDGTLTINDETTSPKRQPGNEFLEDLIKAEIADLFANVILLSAYIDRAENTVKTTRNHTYVDRPEKERE